MSVLFSPFGNQQFSASGTALAVGHKLYTYAAGSSTPLATYTDSTGTTPQTNPIILNSLGMPTNGQIWLTSGLSYKLVWKDASDVEIKTEDDITGVTGTASVSQWQASGLTPTYVSATSFTLAGDQTAAFHVGRRLQSTVTAGTVYSTISASVYGALTTVTVLNTSGALDVGLSAVSYGLITSVDTSAPSQITAGTVQATTSGTSKDFTGIPVGTKRITVMLADVSTNGISLQQVQLGDSGGAEVTGYNSAATTNGVSVTSTTGFLVNYRADAANQTKGALVLTLLDAATNLWVAQGCITGAGGASGDAVVLAGSKALSGTLDRVRLTTVNGTDTFDAGSFNILYE